MAENLEVKIEKPKTFLSSPSQEDLIPTPAEEHYAESILDWQELSLKTPRILGEPEPCYS